MEMYLKRYYWVAILGCIASSSMLVAKTANTFVGTSLEPAPLLGLEQAVRPGGSTAPLIAVDVERLGHLFGIEPPPPPPPTDAGAEDGKPGGAGAKGKRESTDICYTCEPVKTGLRLQLLATMVSPDKHFSTAMISNIDKMEAGLFRVGDPIKNADVYDIIRDPHRVIIANNDSHKLEYIDETPGSGATVVDGLKLPVSPVPPPDGEGGGNMDGIKKLSDTSYTISKAKLDSTLADLNKVATQARIVPSFKNGQANGFKLFSIQPDSIYSAIGVQNGDVITSINGLDINSPEKALEAYSKLKDSQSFDITLDRRGSTVKMNYGVQ